MERTDGHTIYPAPAPDLAIVPEPWDYNPSKWSQRVLVSVIASVAFFLAVHMGLYQWRLIDEPWDPVFGAQSVRVLDSDVSHTMARFLRMPDAILGALAYLGDILFALAGSTRRWQFRPWLVVLFGLDVIPLGIVSAVLVVIQGTVIGAWCFLCLLTAGISLILILLAYDEVWSTTLYLWRVWRTHRDRRLLWNTFWGRPSEEAHAIAYAMAHRES